MALIKGRENVSWGFRNPADGWHTCSFQEGVQLRINDTSGKESLQIPLAVDEGSDDDGCKMSVFINTRDENRAPYKQVDQNIADVLANAGLAEAFNTKFKDADTYLDPKIIDALKLKLPGVFVMVETKMGKDQKNGDRCNIVGWAPKGTKHEAKVPKDNKKESKKSTAAASDAGADW